MTPAEWTRWVRGWNDRERRAELQRVELAWTYAALERQQRLPSLQSLTAPPVKATVLPPEEVERQQQLMQSIAEKLKNRKPKERKPAPQGRRKRSGTE